MREIKQMHRIYQNAHCTLALVPELGCWPLSQGSNHENSSEWWGESANVHVLPNTEWCKRIWTLEEAYVSKSILFVGLNVHIWADVDYLWKILNPSNVVTTMAERTRKWMACTALWYSRKRTSSKQHDRIFALANIFPEIMDRITFSYKQPLLDLMVQFYGALAQKDISVLFFGMPIDSNTDVKIAAARQREGRSLPSWTGARGAHLIQFLMDNKLTTEIIEDYSITGACMILTSRFVTVRIETANALEKPIDFANPNKYRSDGHHKYYTDEHGGHHSFSKEGIPLLPTLSKQCDGYVTDSGCADLIFITIPSESYSVDTLSIHSTGLKVTHGLFLAVEDKVAINSLSKLTHYGGTLSLTEECSNCIILLEPAFLYQPRLPFQPTLSLDIYPVIKKDKNCYKSIGVCFLDRKFNIDPFVQPKQTFHIK
ncbi:hypothetical protein BJV82DRAFT_613033 [Fennellomyces sp. T-0311]|nr:hypothetical protein BJV82DRAFT_613033 [Fennellomyces sp. T-0311]